MVLAIQFKPTLESCPHLIVNLAVSIKAEKFVQPFQTKTTPIAAANPAIKTVVQDVVISGAEKSV